MKINFKDAHDKYSVAFTVLAPVPVTVPNPFSLERVADASNGPVFIAKQLDEIIVVVNSLTDDKVYNVKITSSPGVGETGYGIRVFDKDFTNQIETPQNFRVKDGEAKEFDLVKSANLKAMLDHN